MPKLAPSSNDTMETSQVGSGASAFHFSGTRIQHLGATEYTLATIAIDVTGSTSPFAKELRDALIVAVDACKKSPRSNNLLLRVILFSTSLPGGVEEIHGFKPLADIDTSQYPQFHPGGATPLFDATYSAVAATNAYAKTLMTQDYLANGIVFVITDGDDNSSSATPGMIEAEMKRATKGEEIESLIGIVVGVNAVGCQQYLDTFASGADMKYVDVADATKGKLAKLAAFVSQSVSSQSQSLGTGGPSQAIAVTI